jgi:hypothetical protein
MLAAHFVAGFDQQNQTHQRPKPLNFDPSTNGGTAEKARPNRLSGWKSRK